MPKNGPGRERMLDFIVFAILCPLSIYILFVFPRIPSHERNWSADQALIPTGDLFTAGTHQRVALHNIRNNTYRSTQDYDVEYYDKVIRVEEIETLWYVVEPFSGIGAAHTFLSFGMKDGSYIAFSAEIRKEKGESFSPWLGLIREYELSYVLADERDVIKLRAVDRGDDVYLYPTKATPEQAQEVFMASVRRMNSIARKPEFYNTIFNTCTTNITRVVVSALDIDIPWDLRLLFPKNSDELAMELGLLDTGDLSIEQARRVYKVDPAVAAAYADSIDFSEMIRKNQFAK
jgi:hypothetical protein